MGQSLADFVLGLRHEDIPASVLGLLRRSLVDIFGVAAIGATTELSSIVRTLAAEQFGAGAGRPGARMLFDGRRVSPTGAAMAGAFTIDAVDAHDGLTGSKGHVGSCVIPALLAVADELASSGAAVDGRAFVTALAVAYEVACRAGYALHATACDYHTSGAWAALGAAAGAGRLLGLDAAQLRHAVGIAEYHGPRSQMMRCIDHPTMLRDGVGWGAPAGISAAYLAQLGFTGAPAITIEGADAAGHWADLGTGWMTEKTHYKLYPVCRWAAPAVDLARDLMAQHGFTGDQVANVRIETFHNATRLGGAAPQSLDELSYAIVFPVAAMLARGQIGVPELTPETLQDASILRIARATELAESDEMNRMSVEKRYARVTVTLADGRVLQAGPRSARGDPDEPLSDAEIAAKFHGFADPVIGRPRAEEIAERCAAIDQPAGDVAGLLDRVLAPAGADAFACAEPTGGRLAVLA